MAGGGIVPPFRDSWRVSFRGLLIVLCPSTGLASSLGAGEGNTLATDLKVLLVPPLHA